MKCCVPLCKSTGENYEITVPVRPYVYDRQEQITFNRFPTSPEKRVAWLEVLGLVESDLPPGAVVCSEHFKRNDFTVMSGDIVKLNEDAVPLQFCMICLASSNSKMYPMNQNDLAKAYTTMTGISVSYIWDKSNTMPRLCAECAQRLVNCDGLRDKSLRAYKSLMQLLQNDKVLTLHNLKSIDRVDKQLISNIAKHTFEPDHCDLNVKYNEEDDDIIHSEAEFNSSDTIENTDTNRVKYDDYEKDSTYSDVEYLSESDDVQNDVTNIKKDNKLNYYDVNKAGIINDDVQVKNTNTNNDDIPNNCDAGLTDNVVQVINEGQVNEDVTNVMNNDEDVLLLIIDSADKLKSVENHTNHDTNDNIEDGVGDSMNYHNSEPLKNNHGKLVNRLRGENKSKNGVIVRNIIFLEDSRPNVQDIDFIPDKTNDTLQVLRVYSNKKRKNINNAPTITNYLNKVKSVEESEENVKLNNSSPSIVQETQNRITNNQNKLKNIEKSKENFKFNNSISGIFQETNNHITNNQNKVKSIEESNQNVKLNNSISGVFQETHNRITNNNENKVNSIGQSNKNVKSNNILPGKFQEIQNGIQLSSKNITVKASVPKPNQKVQKKPAQCVPKPKKQNHTSNLIIKTILSYEEQLAEIQKRQYADHYSAYTYKCDICFTGRWSRFTYNRHMDKHTDKNGKWECAVCGIRHKTRTLLRNHLRSHAERYSCKVCNFATSFRAKAYSHLSYHSGHAYSCPHCEAKFRKQSSYFSHVRVKHPSDSLVCPLCGFSFVSKHGVKSHILMSHQTEDLQNLSGPSCEQCDIRFASEAAYNTHMAVSPKHVSSGKPMRNDAHYKSQEGRYRGKPGLSHLCEVCGKNFQSPSCLEQHMNVHNGLKPFKCEVCDKSYAHRISLKFHIQSTHSDSPGRFPCGVCHKRFSLRSSRYKHMLTHNPKRPMYTCSVCNKSFTSLASKVNHVAHVHDRVPRTQRRSKWTRGKDFSDAQDTSVTDTDVASVVDTDSDDDSMAS